MNDNKILLQAIIDADSIKLSDIAKIQKTLDKYPLKLTADFNKEQLLAEIKKAVPEIQMELKNIKDIEIHFNDSAILHAANQIKQLNKDIDSLASKASSIQPAATTEATDRQKNSIGTFLGKAITSAGKYESLKRSPVISTIQDIVKGFA